MNDLIGRTVTDSVTGFSGVVTGFCEYISGCNQVLVVPRIKEDGNLPDAHWIDVQRAVVVTTPRVVLDNGATPGADKPAPVR